MRTNQKQVLTGPLVDALVATVVTLEARSSRPQGQCACANRGGEGGAPPPAGAFFKDADIHPNLSLFGIPLPESAPSTTDTVLGGQARALLVPL